MSEFNWGTKKSRKAIIQRINDWATERDINVIMLGTDASEYAPAIIGMVEEPRPSLLYSGSKVVQCLMKANRWKEQDAIDWYEYNTVRGIPYIPITDNPPTLIVELEDIE